MEEGRVRLLNTLQPLGLLALRLALGAIMVSHGYVKLMGIDKVMQMMTNIHVPTFMAYLVVGAEFFGGILVIIGLLTPFAAAAIAIDMAVAIGKVHFPNGLTGRGGYEFPLACGAIAFALIFLGAGPISLDRPAFSKMPSKRKVKAAYT
jgi:putative oxidoreductase